MTGLNTYVFHEYAMESWELCSPFSAARSIASNQDQQRNIVLNSTRDGDYFIDSIEDQLDPLFNTTVGGGVAGCYCQRCGSRGSGPQQISSLPGTIGLTLSTRKSSNLACGKLADGNEHFQIEGEGGGNRRWLELLWSALPR